MVWEHCARRAHAQREPSVSPPLVLRGRRIADAARPSRRPKEECSVPGSPPRCSGRRARVVVAILFVIVAANPLRAQTAPGGFLVSVGDTGVRTPVTGAAAQAFLPQRGVFTFPAPYNTQGIRITNASDCGGSDCVDYGYSYWNKINNHAGSNTMLIVVGLNRVRGGSGPTLFTLNKSTGETRNAGPLFDANSAFSYATAEQWYFSRSRPSVLYLGENGPRMLRYDVLARRPSRPSST